MYVVERSCGILTMDAACGPTPRDLTVCEATLVTPCSFAASIPVTKDPSPRFCTLIKCTSGLSCDSRPSDTYNVSDISALFPCHASTFYLSSSLLNRFKHHFRPIFRLERSFIFRNPDAVPIYSRSWSSSILFIDTSTTTSSNCKLMPWYAPYNFSPWLSGTKNAIGGLLYTFSTSGILLLVPHTIKSPFHSLKPAHSVKDSTCHPYHPIFKFSSYKFSIVFTFRNNVCLGNAGEH